MAIQSSITFLPSKTLKGRVRKNELKVMVPDATYLSDTIKFVAANEINDQIRLGNNPQNIIVDNQGKKPFTQAKFRVTALFSDPRVIALAAFETIKQLRKLTRKLTGASRGSYQVWIRRGPKDPGKKILNVATAASRTTLEKIATTLPPGGALIIVGPLTDYGRKVYWRPVGKGKDNTPYARRARYRAGYDAETGSVLKVRQGSKNQNIHDIVLRRVRRKFPGLYMRGSWVKERTINGDNNWPGLGIGLKVKGRLR